MLDVASFVRSSLSSQPVSSRCSISVSSSSSEKSQCIPNIGHSHVSSPGPGLVFIVIIASRVSLRDAISKNGGLVVFVVAYVRKFADLCNALHHSSSKSSSTK